MFPKIKAEVTSINEIPDLHWHQVLYNFLEGHSIRRVIPPYIINNKVKTEPAYNEIMGIIDVMKPIVNSIMYAFEFQDQQGLKTQRLFMTIKAKYLPDHQPGPKWKTIVWGDGQKLIEISSIPDVKKLPRKYRRQFETAIEVIARKYLEEKCGVVAKTINKADPDEKNSFQQWEITKKTKGCPASWA